MIRHRCKNKSLNSCQYICEYKIKRKQRKENGDDKNIHKTARIFLFYNTFEYFIKP